MNQQYSASYIGHVVDLADETCTIQLLRQGEWFHRKAPNKTLVIDQERIETLDKNFKAGIKGPELPTNRDHDDPTFANSPSWIKETFIAPDPKNGKDALFCKVEFTDKELEEKVRSKKLKYFSPEIQFGFLNPADGKNYDVLKGAAWTNIPYIKGMQPATFVNLSEMAEDDEELHELLMDQKDPKKVLSSCISAITEAVKKAVPTDGFQYNPWEFNKASLEEGIKSLEKSSYADCATQCSNLQQQVRDNLSSVCTTFPTVRVVVSGNEDMIQRSLLQIMEKRLGETSFTGHPEGAYLAETTDDSPTDSPIHKKLNEGSGDNDAKNPNLPAQCGACSRLSEGTCPFKGISVKIAAAGDGNCPQYISLETELSPSQEAPNAGVSSGDHATPSNEVRMAEKPTNTPQTPVTEVNLAEQVTLLSGIIEANAIRMKAFQDALELSESRRVEEESRRRIIERTTLVDKHRSKLSAFQANCCLSMLSLADGDATIKLSDGTTEATMEALLSEFLDAIEITQAPAEQQSAALPGGKPEAQKPIVLSEKDSEKTEIEKLYPQMVERAKEMSKENNKPWTANMSEASRAVAAEKAMEVVA